MADATTDIRIYPKKEMTAADMAYIVDAASLESGILHGCSISIVNGALEITDGRILIHGRLGYVNGGVIPTPSTSGSHTILAVCDLMAENPFYLGLFDGSTKGALDARVANTTDDAFNASNGVRYITLGTVSYDSTTGTYSNLKLTATVTSSLKVLNNRIATIDNTTANLTSWRKYFYKRLHDSSRFRVYNIDINGITIAAGKTLSLTYYNFYGVTIYITKSESSTPSISGYNRVWFSPSGVYLGGAEPEYLPGSDKDSYLQDVDKYGVPKNVDRDWVHLGIIGVNITNASTGGKNAANCDLVGFYTKENENTVKIHNRGSAAATVRIIQRSLYTTSQ